MRCSAKDPSPGQELLRGALAKAALEEVIRNGKVQNTGLCPREANTVGVLKGTKES